MIKGAPEAEITRLPSGLRVVTQAMPSMRTAAAGVWTRAGARDETREEHGLAHFLEHMTFKGTKRRSPQAIVEEMEAIGGDLNASTTVETTSYYVRLMGGDVPVALDIFADILTNSTFDAQELKREKSVVLQEIGASEDSPEDWAPDLFMEQAFPGQPIGRPILGVRESLKTFDRAMLQAWLDRRYRAPVMVIAAAGDVEHARIVDEAEKLFGGFSSARPTDPTRAIYRGGDVRKARRLEQAHLMLGFEGPSYQGDAHYAAHAFAHVLGGAMSSRLFQEVREKRGLAYAIDAAHWAYSDCGVFCVSAGAGEEDVSDLIAVTLDEIARATHDLSQEELDRARAQMRVSLMSGFESPSQRADQIAHQLLAYDRLVGSDEILAKLDALTIESVRAAGARMLETAPTFTAIGPIRGAPRIDQIAARVGAPVPPSTPAAA
ncbi:pitrilysin family protein [Terrarubrum flagellatum]|uniref:M16 family metallopeptidase n=1 Tax=Terrirubrum flagellatum TaxID=2895980 RepID=UPI0031451C53